MARASEVYDRIRQAVAFPGATADAGLAVGSRYRPLSGSQVSPPRKPGLPPNEPFLVERRRRDGDVEVVVELDSVASQSNRCEIAALESLGQGRCPVVVPLNTVHLELGDDQQHYTYTDLEAPHRIADAYFKYAQTPRGQAFDTTPPGEALAASNGEGTHAGLLVHAPTSLLYGYWNSHRGQPQNMGRAPRAYASRMVGRNPEKIRSRGMRWDAFVRSSEELEDDESQEKGKTQREKKQVTSYGFGLVPYSPIPHDEEKKKWGGPHLDGNVWDTTDVAAVTVDDVERHAHLSFGQLDQLRLHPLRGHAGLDPEQRQTARAFLAAFGLWADRLAFRHSVALRSGCELTITDDDVGFVQDFAAWDPIEDCDADFAGQVLAEAATDLAGRGVALGKGVDLEPDQTGKKIIERHFQGHFPVLDRIDGLADDGG